MKKMTALLIDDEISAINTLKGMLEHYFPEVDILGYAHSVNEATTKAQELLPDVVFLDVEMPPLGSGFDFLEQCHHLGFGVIFVTAYPQYAIKAINDVQPWAYLVKPYSVSELEKGVRAAIEKVEEKKQSVPMDVQRLIVSDARKGNIVIKVVDILYCEADGSTTDIYFFKDGDIVRTVASRTLKDIEENLPSSFFFRSHYSYLVNFIHIIRIERRGRSGVAVLSDGTEIPIAVARMEEFEKRFDDFVHLS